MSKMHSSVDHNFEEQRSKAYTLLIELLAHQFAYPVRWIDTQDTLLGEKKVEDIIEIGPSNTLTSITKQTIDTKYRDHDIALSIKRRLLNTQNNSDEIYHIAENDSPEKPLEQSEPATAPSVSQPPVNSEIAVTLIPVTTSSSNNEKASIVANSAFLDTPVTAEAILKTVIAQKLKRRTDDISGHTSIKTLVAGRSTLENEIIGDLLKEFGTIPDRSEERPLEDLATSLTVSEGNKLGKHTLLLIQRTISSTFPGDFSLTKVRKYLQERWNFKEGRQDAVLLSFITSPSSIRLQNAAEVHSYVDTKVKIYANDAGLTLEAQHNVPGVVVRADENTMQAITKEQENLAKQQLHAYAEFLKIDLLSNEKASQALSETIQKLQTQLDSIHAEHDEVYIMGVAPMFKPQFVRSYSSYWNWATQDLLILVHGITTGTVTLDTPTLSETIFRIANRSTPKLLADIQFLAQHFQNHNSGPIFEILIHDTQIAMKSPPVFRSLQGRAFEKTHQKQMDYTPTSKQLKYPTESHYLSERNSSHELIKQRRDNQWKPIPALTDMFIQNRDRINTSGSSFQHLTVLLTGSGKDSIGEQILIGLLSGGAKVVVTSSSFSPKTANSYQRIYATWGSKGSQLVLVPFNQGSQQDVNSLIEHIYNTKQGLGWDIDVIIPFAAVSIEGKEIDEIDSKSELAHRVMLINVIRLLGSIKKHKKSAGYRGKPAQVILPLSPNHGIFGGDGLYAESKVAMEALLEKWHSEDWKDYLSICGVSIGWVRGTGLMKQNDVIVHGVEKVGLKTYSPREMAIDIFGLLDRSLVTTCQAEPLFADFGGGLDTISGLKDIVLRIRHDMNVNDSIKRAVVADLDEERRIVEGKSEVAEPIHGKAKIRRPRLGLGFPRLPDYATEIATLNKSLDGMVDLGRAVVIVGFGELGPCGNARTRWEMEVQDEFSMEGCLEMAWIMGLIKFSKDSRNRAPGWIDVKTKERINDYDVKSRYEEHIRKHSGIRLIEPTFASNYDPHKKSMTQEIVLQQDLPPFEVSKSSALSFQNEHGDMAVILPTEDSENFTVTLKKGATIFVPKAVRFGNDVAAQIPQGWDPRTYGISEDVIDQVDPATLYALVTTVDAMFSAGITDPYEIYQYIHLSELGNCIGTGVGGIASLTKMYREQFQGKTVQSDILQETFLNTIGAWINMLLLSSAGPIRSPVGACATSLESLDSAYDLITSSKAKMCFVGGVDDFGEEMSFEFARMKATSNADTEREIGRSPAEMSRPAASSRKGFVESQGSGIQIVCTAALALKMCLPVYGIVAFTGISSDKASRSVPAPGKGVLVNTRESRSAYTPRLLDINYRRRQINVRKAQISEFKMTETEELEHTINHMASIDPSFNSKEYRHHMLNHIRMEAETQEQDILNNFGNHFWRNVTEISPIRGALATWGLTVDDINVASFHGTSTVKNEINECSIIQQQMDHLGRSKGNRLLGVFQKSLTGHPKGAAGAWMLNGCLQIFRSGLIPGNRNLDNLEDDFSAFDHIAFMNKPVQTTGVKAASVTSFGFGQKGAQTIVLHPKYLFAAIPRSQYDEYAVKVKERERRATGHFTKALIENSLFSAKDRPPYESKEEVSFLLDPNARVATGI
ncbi:fatty acid synthase subunit alpha [Phlyctema vagabunda]|uniref:beta-ketoacyl-[acyl-carrier-protein] synthase I n=1 Tax=Phlyctema vagabunda TaxID=108571 RepID=A0ABR4PUI3_9HELO